MLIIKHRVNTSKELKKLSHNFGVEIDLRSNNQNIYLHHDPFKNGELFSDGGRVLNITSMGDSFFKIRLKIIKIIRKLNWKSGFYRKDIGWRVINKNANN